MLLSAVALIGAACGAPAADPGLRGSGTTYHPRDSDVAAAAPVASDADAESMAIPTLMPLPRLIPTPTPYPLAESDPIVPADAIPPLVAGSTEQEMHVVPVPSKPPIANALPARRVVIPSIGLDSKVIQLGTKLDRRGQIAWETAPFAVGQHKGLAGPGQNGNMVLSGHISSPNEGAVFHSLPDLKVGEGVVVATEERQYLYRVVDVKTVTPDQVEVLNQTPDATATLITCVPDGIYSHRLVITARLV